MKPDSRPQGEAVATLTDLISKFHNRVIAEAPGCPIPRIDVAVVNAIRRMCHDTYAYSKSFEAEDIDYTTIDTADNDALTIDLSTYITNVEPIAPLKFQIDGGDWVLRKLILENDNSNLSDIELQGVKFFNFPSLTTMKIFPFTNQQINFDIFLKMAVKIPRDLDLHETQTEYGAELVTNGDMELDDNWISYGTPTVQEISTTQKHAGTYSRKFTVDAQLEGIQGDSFTTVDGYTYDITFWVYPTVFTSMAVNIRRGDNSGWADALTWTDLTQNAWNECSGSWVEGAATGGAGAYLAIYAIGSAGTYYIDDVSVKRRFTSSASIPVDDIFYNNDNWFEGIIHRALYRLQMIPGRSWSNAELALYNLSMYRHYMGLVKINDDLGGAAGDLTIQGGYF